MTKRSPDSCSGPWSRGRSRGVAVAHAQVVYPVNTTYPFGTQPASYGHDYAVAGELAPDAERSVDSDVNSGWRGG